MHRLVLCLFFAASVLLISVTCHTDAMLAPPGRPKEFRTPDQLRRYLKALNDYYAIVGRPRFGRSANKQPLSRSYDEPSDNVPYGVFSLEEWKQVLHIKDGVTSTDYINSVTADTAPLCLIRCSYEANCSMIGYSAPQKICDLYGNLLTDDLSFTFQDSTEFYAHSSLFFGMTCTAVDVANAVRTPYQTEYSYSDIVQYSCDDSYERTSGTTARICIAIDRWSGSDIVCTVITCAVVDVTDSTKHPDKVSYAYNEVVTYMCDPGFELTSGSQTRTCTAIDTWSGSMPTCTAITCASPGEVSDASMAPNKALYDYNEDVTYTCEIGFEKTSGDLTRTCTAIDNWSGSQPVCTVITCASVDIPGASKDPNKVSYGYNEVVTYTCTIGYQHTAGDLVRTCTAIDTWSGVTPVCTAVTCAAVNVEGASKDPDKDLYVYNEVVTYSCNPGYDHTSGDLVNTCTAIDTWSGTRPICTGQGCSSLSVVPDTTMNPNKASYSHSETVTYTCNSGFRHTSGNLVRTCTAGTWSGAQPGCTGVTCSEVNVANAAKSPDKASYTYNEAVTYTCNPGYELTNGDSVRRCENMNTWSDSYPICTAVTCSPLTLDDGSRSPIKSSYAYNEVVTYICNAGFAHQSGDLTRTCTGINSWSGNPPVCASGCSNSAYNYHESYSLCIRVSTDQTDWHSARANCQADGADLVMVKDAGFKVYLQDNVLTNDRYWIGAYHTPGDPNDWHWVDGSSLSTAHHMWAANEPNNSNEECAEILFFAGVLSANNHLCDRTYKYVCSMSAAL